MKKALSITSSLLVFVMLCSIFSFPAAAMESIENAEITLSRTEYTYNGKEHTPIVTVSIKNLLGQDVILTKDTDYTVAYGDNVNAGTAGVTVEGIGNYEGTATAEFTVKARKISGKSIKAKQLKKAVVGVNPKYSLKYNGAELVKGTDYTVEYKNINKAGVKSGKVVFTGIGNFTGTKTIKVNVSPRKVTKFKSKRRNTKSVIVTWKSQKKYGVESYKVYLCNEKGKKTKYYKTVSKNKVTIKNLKPGTYCYIKVRALVKKGKTRVYGKYSDVYRTTTKPKKVELVAVAKGTSGKTLIVEWKNVSCTGYEIMYSTKKDFSSKVKDVKFNNSKTKRYLYIPKTKKHYYVKVRAFRAYNHGKTHVYGKWSKKFSTNYSVLYASYSSTYVRNAARTNNLRLACKAISGTIVQPGATFSFNGTVGERTAAKGYKAAHVFTGPTTMTMGIGGGVCQVASTMFNAALLANFKIVERHQHAQRVTYVPLGRDAAIYWGSENFRFKNNTKYPVKIKMWCKNQKIHCNYYICYNAKPKKVKLRVYRSGNHFTLKRSVNGKVNYTCRSHY
ncbi:MAG: VanW family protein [Eubacterium sp.]|nr:VanW family protein [Eubacterium sp.]